MVEFYLVTTSCPNLFFFHCCCIATIYSASAALGHTRCSQISLLQIGHCSAGKKMCAARLISMQQQQVGSWPWIPSWAGAKISSQYHWGGAGSNGKVVAPLWEPSQETVGGSGASSLCASSPGPGSLSPTGAQQSLVAVYSWCTKMTLAIPCCKQLVWPREVSIVVSYLVKWSFPSLCWGAAWKVKLRTELPAPAGLCSAVALPNPS